MMQVVLTQERVEGLVSRACREVEKNDSFLFDKDVSEWAVAHRLAAYLESFFPEYDVDCEYNRMPGPDGKYGSKAPKKVLGNKKIRPDIIVHRRGSNEDNLIAIEMKKDSNRAGTDQDIETLHAMKDELHYMHAVMIVITEGNLEESFV